MSQQQKMMEGHRVLVSVSKCAELILTLWFCGWKAVWAGWGGSEGGGRFFEAQSGGEVD